MSFKSKKGYSLIEIGVGVLILTVFLICSIALFNGCYNTYRMIQQRNLAINTAVQSMEELLQADEDILTGFFTQELNAATNEYELKVNDDFQTFVEDNFDADFITRYAKLKNLNVADITSVSNEEMEEYIYEDRDFLINLYIQEVISEYSTAELESDEVQSGNYVFLTSNVIELGNEALLNPGTGATGSSIGEMAIRKTILRLPPTNDVAYGNHILKLKVEVLYSNKINTNGIQASDVKSIVLESVKIAD